MSISRTRWMLNLAVALLLTPAAYATIPYTPVTVGGTFLGAGYALPSEAAGKEYSHDFDHTTAGPGGAPDGQQIVAWDGVGGTADGLDFTGTRPNWTPDQEIDAIANHGDAFFQRLRRDSTHLVFTHDDEISYITASGGSFTGGMPAGGPVLLSNGNTIGGAGEVSIELAGAYTPPETQFLWASQSEVNGMPLPRDVDGLEIWGPEPGLTGDVDKYSLDLDFLSGASVWNGSGTPYLSHASVITAVESLLGAIPGPALAPFDDQEGQNAINIDALMVRDDFGSDDSFDRDPTGSGDGDTMIFSIRQIVDPSDPSGYYATGSELFVLNRATGASFLSHGGHDWDKAYALGSLGVVGPNGDAFGVIDINGIETVAGVPEPAGVAMLATGLYAMVAMRRRLG